MDDRNNLLNWLTVSEKLLGDSLDAQELGRMTMDELQNLAAERAQKLIGKSEAQIREADALEAYSITRPSLN